MADPGAPADHQHDPLIVASAVGHTAAGPNVVLASGWGSCPACVRLHRELTSIAAALPMTWTPARPRDYRLEGADARRLRPGGWRGWWRRFGTARDTFSRPLAAGLTTLGVAGLLVAAVPGAVGTGATGAAPVPMIESAAQPTDDGSVTRSTATAPGSMYGAPVSSSSDPEPGGVPPFVVLSWSFVTAGGGLFVARAVSGRRAMR